MKKILSHVMSLAVLAVSASPALAQESDWDFGATIYSFISETEVGIGDVEGTLSFSDALDNLDVAFTGAFEASNGDWSFLLDYMLSDLSFVNNQAGPVVTDVNTSSKTQILSGYAAYRIYDTPDTLVDIAAGFRWFDTSSKISLLDVSTVVGSASSSDNWVDPVIGIRAQYAFSDKWSGTVFADYGGFRSDSETWQVLLTANYAFNDRWVGRFGYRQLSVDHDIDGNSFSYDQSGPILGVTFKF